MAKKVQNKNTDRRKKGTSLSKSLREGSLVTMEYIRRYAWLLVAFLAVIISLMGLRYKTKTKMMEIKDLERELMLAQSLKLEEKAKYMSLIRENEMLKLVSEQRLGLQFREQPPYVITIDSIENN